MPPSVEEEIFNSHYCIPRKPGQETNYHKTKNPVMSLARLFCACEGTVTSVLLASS